MYKPLIVLNTYIVLNIDLSHIQKWESMLVARREISLMNEYLLSSVSLPNSLNKLLLCAQTCMKKVPKPNC